MIRHFIKIAIKNLKRDKISSVFSFLGLAVSMGCAFLIILFIINETGFDRSYQDYNRICRINVDMGIKAEITPPALAEKARAGLPEIEDITRVFNLTQRIGGYVLSETDEMLKVSNLKVVDPGFFRIFRLKMLEGQEAVALQNPTEILISSDFKEKYFKDSEVIGEVVVIKLDSVRHNLVIRGVFQNDPLSTVTQSDVIGSSAILPKVQMDRWDALNTVTYALIKNKTNWESLGKKIEKLIKDQAGYEWSITLQPAASMYLHSEGLQFYMKPRGNLQRLWSLGIVGAVLILLASINFILISTARASGRMKEMAVRKILGAGFSDILKQGMSESLIVAISALPLALILAELFLPLFCKMVKTHLQIAYFDNWKYILGIFTITLLVASINGIYMSFHLSAISPSRILQKSKGKVKAFSRQLMIGLQGTAFSTLIVFTLIINLQIRYMEKKSRGFDASNIILLNVPENENINQGCHSFTDEIEKMPQVSGISYCAVGPFGNSIIFQNIGMIDNPDKKIEIKSFLVESSFMDLLDFKIIAGRGFSRDYTNETGKVILNETALNQLGFSGDPIGKKVEGYEIIGIVKDFHFKSLQNKVDPVFFYCLTDPKRKIEQFEIKLDSGFSKTLINSLKQKWEQHFGTIEFDFSFCEGYLNKQYADDKMFGNIIGIMAIITFIVAGLGLFGFSWLIVQQRQKEVAIRKVYGSSPNDVLIMFLKKFSLQFLVSSLISWPIAYYISSAWLKNYSYRIEIPPVTFIMATLFCLIISIMTVMISVIRVSQTVAVESLKYE
jgi:putative ABC transport system permease protein